MTLTKNFHHLVSTNPVSEAGLVAYTFKDRVLAVRYGATVTELLSSSPTQ